MDLVSFWIPSHGGWRPNPGQATVEPNETGVQVHGLLPLFLALHGDWIPWQRSSVPQKTPTYFPTTCPWTSKTLFLILLFPSENPKLQIRLTPQTGLELMC